MTKLSDTQLVILSAAARRPNRLAIPLPDRLKGGAAQKVVDSMLARGLLARVPAAPGMPAFGAQAEDGSWSTLVATDAGLDAIGIEPDDANTLPAGATDAPTEEPAPDTPTEPEATPKARTPREGTKQATLIAMLRAPGGATIEEIAAALEWAHHTVRGAMAGALKKKLGLEVTSEKVEDRGRVYKLPAA